MNNDFTRPQQTFNAPRFQRASSRQRLKRSPQKNKPSFPKTFRQICDDVRVPNASRIFDRGRQASRMRHLAIKQKRWHQAKILAYFKAMVLKRAYRLAPDIVSVGLDSDYQIGLLRVRWPGKGALHLPPDTDIG